MGVRSFLDLSSRPVVYLMSPPPLFKDGYEGMSADVVSNSIPPILKTVASDLGERVIFVEAVTDVFGGKSRSCTGCMFEEAFARYGDGCHPVAYGYSQMALALCIATAQGCHCPYVKPSTRMLWFELAIGTLVASVIVMSGCWLWQDCISGSECDGCCGDKVPSDCEHSKPLCPEAREVAAPAS